MIDVVLLIGRLLFVALLYLFLFAIMKTGIGLVRGQRTKERAWTVMVEKGPKELRGIQIVVHGPVIIGRSPGADIVIGASYVSGRHARFSLMGQNLFIEDLGSTNGTLVNGYAVDEPVPLKSNDIVNVGDVAIRVRYI
ncbi:MAG: FHA domain-containing protein [Coriobacteriaceae bacterium]|nr:FHA domain-containing protein [Coriobacteriaceae bacterium]